MRTAMDDCACAEMIVAAGGASCETVCAATATVIVLFGWLPVISFGGASAFEVWRRWVVSVVVKV